MVSKAVPLFADATATDQAYINMRDEVSPEAAASKRFAVELWLAELRLSLDRLHSTHTCLWRFSGPLTGLLCKRPFAEFIERNRIRCKRSSPVNIAMTIWSSIRNLTLS
jgi:hypothetical protein